MSIRDGIPATPVNTSREFELSHMYTPPAAPPKGESFARKIAFGILCSLICTALINFFSLKKFVLYFFAAVLSLCGWHTKPPGEGEKPGVFDKLKHVVSDVGHKVGHKVGDKLNDAKDKGGELVESAKHAPEKAKELAHKTAEEIKENISFHPFPAITPEQAERMRLDREAALKDRQERAVAAWEKEVARLRRDLDGQAYNGQCPSPRCRQAIHLKPSHSKQRLLCYRCRQHFMGSVARNLGPPDAITAQAPLRGRP